MIKNANENADMRNLSHAFRWRSNAARLAALFLIVYAWINTEEYGPVLMIGFIVASSIFTLAHGVIVGRREMYRALTQSELAKPPIWIRSIVYNLLIVVVGVFTLWTFW